MMRRKIVQAYVDGSALRNGQYGASAGWGCCFLGWTGLGNYSGPVDGAQTNNRAELTAILKACEIAPWEADLRIYTDSQYAANCVTEWWEKWSQNGWVSNRGLPIENVDLITAIIRAFRQRPVYPTVIWIEGHNNNQFNDRADELAREAAQEAMRSSGYYSSDDDDYY